MEGIYSEIKEAKDRKLIFLRERKERRKERMEEIYSESKARDRKLIFEEKEKKGRKKKRKERIR